MSERTHGVIAIVGSGEYLPQHREFELSLLRSGGSHRYVQIPTAAGRESDDRIRYWQELGAAQAQMMRAEQVYLPIYNREDAMREDLAQLIDGAGLIYLSGGDPHHLAQSLIGTPVHDAIVRNWISGSSLAGCSAGAMAFGSDIPHFRNLKKEGEAGLSILPHIRTIPHYNKFFRWIPEAAAQKFLRAPEGTHVIGVDENTAAISEDKRVWRVQGVGKVHVLTGPSIGVYAADESFEILI